MLHPVCKSSLIQIQELNWNFKSIVISIPNSFISGAQQVYISQLPEIVHMQDCEIDSAITLSLEGKVECQAHDLSLQMTKIPNLFYFWLFHFSISAMEGKSHWQFILI